MLSFNLQRADVCHQDKRLYAQHEADVIKMNHREYILLTLSLWHLGDNGRQQVMGHYGKTLGQGFNTALITVTDNWWGFPGHEATADCLLRRRRRDRPSIGGGGARRCSHKRLKVTGAGKRKRPCKTTHPGPTHKSWEKKKRFESKAEEAERGRREIGASKYIST